jgi:predicted site-specific integrase-resolvase
MIKLSVAAKKLGITKQTLYNWRRAGKISFERSSTGLNFLSNATFSELMHEEVRTTTNVAVYARVSSSENKTSLEAQKERLVAYCAAKGYQLKRVVTETGSGFNDSRPRLQSLLIDQSIDLIVVEHKDRLTRAGFNYIETLLNMSNRKIEVINQVDTDEASLVQDFASIITSFSARVYGKRRSQRKTEQLIESLSEDKP